MDSQSFAEHEQARHRLLAELEQPGARASYVRAVEWLLHDRLTLLRLCPPCPAHGPECSADAREWIMEKRAEERGLTDPKD